MIENIDMKQPCPAIYDKAGNKFCIDFINNKTNYHKKKSGLKTELLSKALGGGKHGFKVLDLTAGLGIDAVFLAQMGYKVTALERNPLIYLALRHANQQLAAPMNLGFEFAEAADYLKSTCEEFDIIYFDPMFPEKNKSALPRQEMVFFKNLVGADEDASDVLKLAQQMRSLKRVTVKRPIKAPALLNNPLASLAGKLVRFDIYGVAQ